MNQLTNEEIMHLHAQICSLPEGYIEAEGLPDVLDLSKCRIKTFSVPYHKSISVDDAWYFENAYTYLYATLADGFKIIRKATTNILGAIMFILYLVKPYTK